MLSHGHSLLDQMVEILRDLGCQSMSTQHPHNLVTGDGTNLTDSMGVTEDDADLGGGETFLGETAY